MPPAGPTPWPWFVSPGATAALIVATVAVRRSASWRSVRAAYDGLAVLHPNYVVHLE